MADPYFSDVILLLPMEGEDNSTTFTDISLTPKSVTANGNAKISTTQSKWGNGSGYFDGVGDYLSMSNAAFAFGTSNFTIEMWVYPSGSGSFQTFVSTRDVNQGIFFGLNTGGLYPVCYNKSTMLALSPISLSSAQWNHVALSRSGSALTIFVDGMIAVKVGISENFTSSILRVGITDTSLIYPFTGYLQDIRITTGIGRYGNFTPPNKLFSPVGISGIAVKIGGGAAEQVVIRNATTRELEVVAIPASNGEWTAEVSPGDYDISYFADGLKPLCHGPYTVSG